MNSDKAADVRDSLNALPCVAHDVEPHPNYPADGHTTKRRGSTEWTHTGNCVKAEDFVFRPAEVNEAGQIAIDGGPMRPCYEVLLAPLMIPTRPAPGVSIPPSVVHEAAKHGCRIRDDLAHEEQPDDRDRCDGCGCVRFELKDGEPHCARCGESQVEPTEPGSPKLEDYV